MRSKFLISLLLSCSFLFSSSSARGLSVRELYNVLEDQGVSFDGQVVQAAAVEAMLKAVDAGAKLSSVAELQAMLDRPTLVDAKEWPEGICFIKVGALTGNSTSAVERIAKWLNNAETSGIIMDLRGASGDNLDAVDAIAGLFLASGTETCSLRDGRGRIVEQRKIVAGSSESHVPLMIAIDSDTRGAAEALAAVLKGRSGVLLVGGKTRGDMAIREVLPLSGGEALYLSTKRILVAGQAAADDGRIQPDIEVTHYGRSGLPEKAPFGKRFSEKSLNDRKLMELVMTDAVLGSATDTLLGLKALGYNVAATNTASLTEK